MLSVQEMTLSCFFALDIYWLSYPQITPQSLLEKILDPLLQARSCDVSCLFLNPFVRNVSEELRLTWSLHCFTWWLISLALAKKELMCKYIKSVKLKFFPSEGFKSMYHGMLG